MKKKEKNKQIVTLAAVLFALLFWQLAAKRLDQSLLIPEPEEVLLRLWQIIKNKELFFAAGNSLGAISGGFFAALLLAVCLAALSAWREEIEIFLAPYMLAIKTVPVASFIIIALIWLSAKNLSSFISFLMVLPIIYTNVLEGIKNTDRQKLFMCEIFRVSSFKKLLYVYLPGLRTYLYSALSVSVGIAWKAGVAAEVIGIPEGSMGRRLYDAKIYLDTPSLLAWTLGIILISLLFEQLILLGVRAFYTALEKI
ncbi:MAG: ABC transporter permease subunit [Johnsonella sp.]|nr:ABC transporter permease subunit [Johnsonella sp.]